MLYLLNKEVTAALGELVSSSGAKDASIEITEGMIKISLSDAKKAKAKKQQSVKAASKPKLKVKGKDGKAEIVEYNGVSMTRNEWAKKLNVSPRCISYRMTLHKSPYGPRDPVGSDKDKPVQFKSL